MPKNLLKRGRLYKKRTKELRTHLLDRGYQTTTVDAQIQKASRLPRTEALNPNTHRQPTRRIPLVVTYHPGLTNLSRIARKHLPILHTSSKLKEAIPDPPIIAFRRPKNIKDLLVRAKLNPPSPPTNAINTRCNNNHCKCCHEMVTCSKFKSKTTGRQYNIGAEITCKTRNLVYLISCKRCGLQYIGETEKTLHIRMNSHCSDIRTRKTEKPVAVHFCQSDHSVKDLEVRGITSTQWRRERESFWIFTLRTLAPDGMNLDE